MMQQHSREDMLEGRILALTKENERLKLESNLGKSHSRTSSMGGFPSMKLPAYPSDGPSTPILTGTHRRSEDDMLNMSNSQPIHTDHLAASPGDPRYNQLLNEYRRVCHELSSRNSSSWRGGSSGSHVPPPMPPLNGDFGPNAVAYWHQAAAGSSSHGGGHSPPQSQPQVVSTPTIPTPSSPAPQSPKILPQASPTTKGPSKLSAPPASTQPVKKVSKKQQEINAENMSKDAYITYLERLIQNKDEMLAKYEGTGPETLDSAVQATVRTTIARTQTEHDSEEQHDGGDASSSSSAADVDPTYVDGKSLLLDAHQMLTVSGFTTLRPLTLQLVADPALTLVGSGAGGAGGASPQPRWQHRPYGGLSGSKKRSSIPGLGNSAEGTPMMVDLVDVSAPSGSLRWADEPCDLDLAPPTPHLDRRNASLTGAGASTSSLRADSQSNLSASRGSGAAWRGGSRTAARGSVVQTL